MKNQFACDIISLTLERVVAQKTITSIITRVSGYSIWEANEYQEGTYVALINEKN